MDLRFRDEIGFFPVFPCFERLPVDFGREAHAIALFEVHPDDHHFGAAREIRTVFPQRARGGRVLVPDLQLFDCLPSKRTTRLGPKRIYLLFANVCQNTLRFTIQAHRFDPQFPAIS